MNPSHRPIVMYCRKGCEDSELARNVLTDKGIPFTQVDIDQDPQALAFVRAVNRGYESTPTLLLPTGEILVEPSEAKLLETLERLGLLRGQKGGDALRKAAESLP